MRRMMTDNPIPPGAVPYVEPPDLKPQGYVEEPDPADEPDEDDEDDEDDAEEDLGVVVLGQDDDS
jgi:hypothetical protein